MLITLAIILLLTLIVFGDSGYDTHFAEIGRRHWPIDLANKIIDSMTPPGSLFIRFPTKF